MPRRLHLPLPSALAVLLAAAGCGGVDSGDTEHAANAGKPTCSAIASACHGSADATGEECHEMGHAPESTEEQCVAMRDECLAICGEGGGHGH